MTVYLFIAKGKSWGTDRKVKVADPKEYAKELIRLNPGVIEVSWMTLGKDFGKVYGKIQCPTPRVRNKKNLSMLEYQVAAKASINRQLARM